MFLKSMELMGFKSFADRTHIDFSPGISALLGPNGCGKSNIVDAVKWVLGEQSTKNMRALKMEDVIFNGTVKRKALNVAEVTLTISNETNILEIDAPEIEIKRRLYRNGDSEYFINNTVVRLKELRELFFDTGIGKTAYSILEQGKIDQILSSRPEERRYLFEEAAGITKYKLKGIEAAKKLEKTRDNIKQVQNILTEVSKSYFTLKEQSEKTTEYRDIKNKLFDIDVNLQLLKIEKLKELHQRRGEEHKQREKSLKSIEDDIKLLGSDLSESHRNQGQIKNTLSESQKKLYGLGVEKESLKNRITANKDREKEYNLQFKSLDERESKYNLRSKELKSDIEEKNRTSESLKSELITFEKNLSKYITENSRFSEHVQGLTDNIENNSNNVATYEDKKDGIIENIKDLATKITDKLEESLKSFSIEKHETLVEMFRKQLKLSKTNPSILFNLERDFDELINNFPINLLKLISEDKNLSQKKSYDLELKDITIKIQECKSVIQKSKDEIKLTNSKIEINSELISKEKIKIAESKVKLSGIEENLVLINKNLVEEETLLNEIKRERIQIGEKIKQIVMDRETLSKKLEELKLSEEKISSDIKKMEEEVNKLLNNNRDKEQLLNKKRENLSKISLQIERYNFETEHIDNKVAELYEEFKDKYSIELTDAKNSTEILNRDEDALKQAIADLRVKQKMIGQINLMAPEEFKEVSKRYHFLKSQIEDLKNADENLSKITEQIKSESTKLFSETFFNIQKSFSVMYQRLFGGGSAELQLTDPHNVLESGIEIYARPPGKSLENISLLSGGERSLTAVALLFATYEIKPSPFCILDEIDAALDERNISRFVNTLTEFSKESQFIVITHNKKTVTGSGALLGVTMQESGVSKLITMRLEHEEEEE